MIEKFVYFGVLFLKYRSSSKSLLIGGGGGRAEYVHIDLCIILNCPSVAGHGDQSQSLSSGALPPTNQIYWPLDNIEMMKSAYFACMFAQI